MSDEFPDTPTLTVVPELEAFFVEFGFEVDIGPGEVLVREGDHANICFLIKSGSMHVLARAFDRSDVVLARLGPGNIFGEQVMLEDPNARHRATVRAVTHCRLVGVVRSDVFALDHGGALAAHIRNLVEQQRHARHSKLRDGVLRHMGLAGRYAIERFAPGQVLCRQGSLARKVHLVLEGIVTMHLHDTDEMVAELSRGMLIGEQAALHDGFNPATLVAKTEVETATLEATWFRNAQPHSPLLASLVKFQRLLFELPRRGVLHLRGDVGSNLTVTARQTLDDGRTVESVCIVGNAAITVRVLNAPEATIVHRFEDPQENRIRAVHMEGGEIIEIESDDEWVQLPTVIEMLFAKTQVPASVFADLAKTGVLHLVARAAQEDREFVCHCARVTRVRLEQVIKSGCRTLEEIARETRATRDCGECVSRINELLGDASWTPARCVSITPVTEDVRTFHLRLLRSKCLPWRPGQHIVLQARIEGRWFARPYTITGVADSGDIYEITVKRESNGTVSQWLFDRLRGDSDLRVSAPAGAFLTGENHSLDTVCLVGGIGITPALALARSMAGRPDGSRLMIDYAVSTLSQAIYREELEEILLANEHIKINLRITQRDGRMTKSDLEEIVRDYPDAKYYLCGRRGHMEAMESYLAALGVPPERVVAIHFRSEAEWYAGLSGAWPVASAQETDAPSRFMRIRR